MINNRFENNPDAFFSAKSGPNLEGHLLVASPAIANGPFHRAVVLVIQQDDDETFGVVLNRPAEDDVVKAWSDMTGRTFADGCVVKGGPVDGPVIAIHPYHSIAEMAMPGGIYLSSNSQILRRLSDAPDNNYRICFGVARWAQGQLKHELERGLWLPIQADADRIFGDPRWMWQKGVQEYGRLLICDVVGLSGLPEDPTNN